MECRLIQNISTSQIKIHEVGACNNILVEQDLPLLLISFSGVSSDGSPSLASADRPSSLASADRPSYLTSDDSSSEEYTMSVCKILIIILHL